MGLFGKKKKNKKDEGDKPILPVKGRVGKKRPPATEGERTSRRYDKDNITVPKPDSKDVAAIDNQIDAYIKKTGIEDLDKKRKKKLVRGFKLRENPDGTFSRIKSDDDE